MPRASKLSNLHPPNTLLLPTFYNFFTFIILDLNFYDPRNGFLPTRFLQMAHLTVQRSSSPSICLLLMVTVGLAAMASLRSTTFTPRSFRKASKLLQDSNFHESQKLDMVGVKFLRIPKFREDWPNLLHKLIPYALTDKPEIRFDELARWIIDESARRIGIELSTTDQTS